MVAKLFTGSKVQVVDRKNTMYFQLYLHTLNHTIDVLCKRRKKFKKDYTKGLKDFQKGCGDCRKKNEELQQQREGIKISLDCSDCFKRHQEYDRNKIHADKMFSLDRVLGMYRRMRTETRTDVACLGSKFRRKKNEKG